jgi:hypothetical protein
VNLSSFIWPFPFGKNVSVQKVRTTTDGLGICLAEVWNRSGWVYPRQPEVGGTNKAILPNICSNEKDTLKAGTKEN